MYGIEKAKLSDDKNRDSYVNDMMANCEEIASRLDNWPYSKQRVKQTLYEIFLEN